MRVDFYIVQDEQQDALHHVASRLLTKAYAKNLRVWVLCSDKNHAKTLDDYLWTYQANSFLPHSLAGEAPEGLNPPIQISTSAPPPDHDFSLLLNLTENIPEHHTNFTRVLEVVAHDAKDAGRARYRAYRDQKCDLHKHNI